MTLVHTEYLSPLCVDRTARGKRHRLAGIPQYGDYAIAHELPLRQSIDDKITHMIGNDIYEYAVEYLGIPAEVFQLRIGCLVAIQETIYDIDVYGEENFQVNRPLLGRKWVSVERSLREAGMTLTDRDHHVEALRFYQAIEERLRQGWTPSVVDIVPCVRAKSSDVALLRAVASRDYPSQAADEVFFRAVEACRELIDDTRDIAEDASTWNLNLVLAAVHVHGTEAGCNIMEQTQFSQLADLSDMVSAGGLSNPVGAVSILERLQQECTACTIALRSAMFRHTGQRASARGSRRYCYADVA